MIDLATAVYEAVEPIIIWKTLYNGLEPGLNGQESHVGISSQPASRARLISQSSELFPWLLTSVRQHDEEVLSLHIPVMLDSLLDYLIVSDLSAVS
jgi:hypothetical protein